MTEYERPSNVISWVKYSEAEPEIDIWWYEEDKGEAPGRVRARDSGYRFRAVGYPIGEFIGYYKVVYDRNLDLEEMGYVRPLEHYWVHGK